MADPLSMYEALGVAPDATTKEIKAAYRRLAQEYHPDRPDGDAAKFLPVQEAYDTLGNDKRRERYDRTGDASDMRFEDLVRDKLMQLFNGMLVNEQDIAGDAVEQMMKMIQNGINGTQDNQHKVERSKARVMKRRDRIKSSEGNTNLYRQLADQQITQCDCEIERLGEEIDVLNEVLAQMDTYEDIAPMEKYTTAYYTTGATTA